LHCEFDGGHGDLSVVAGLAEFVFDEVLEEALDDSEAVEEGVEEGEEYSELDDVGEDGLEDHNGCVEYELEGCHEHHFVF